jgi:hypothetical protein
MTYKSTFQDRAGQAAEAKRKALDQYRSRPPVDEKLAAERRVAGEAREAAKAEKAATRAPTPQPGRLQRLRRRRSSSRPRAMPAMRQGRRGDKGAGRTPPTSRTCFVTAPALSVAGGAITSDNLAPRPSRVSQLSTAAVAQAAAFGGQLYGWADWGGGPLSFVSTDDSGPFGFW